MTRLRFDRLSAPFVSVQHPVYAVVVQGRKQAMIGDTLAHYAAGDTLVAGIDLPVTARIIEASAEVPNLPVSIALEAAVVHDLLEAHPPAAAPDRDTAPFGARPFRKLPRSTNTA